MHLLFPSDSFNPKVPDEDYAEEWHGVSEAGFKASLFNFDAFRQGESPRLHKLAPGETVLYRGWMMTKEEYERFQDLIASVGDRLLTSLPDYLLCHHLPSWYPLLSEYTARTFFFDEGADLPAALREKGWEGCFLKDHVKSLSTAEGSLVRDLDHIPEVVAKMRKYRGFIEGGLCAREIEIYRPESEHRFFICQGTPHGDAMEIPECVHAAASVIRSPFFTVDVATRDDGTQRIIELGDAQVSGRKHWSVPRFVEMLKSGLCS